MQDTRYDIRVYLQPAFLICVAVLAVAGGSMSIAIKSLGIYLKKDPWPLKKSLDLLDEGKLALSSRPRRLRDGATRSAPAHNAAGPTR